MRTLLTRVRLSERTQILLRSLRAMGGDEAVSDVLKEAMRDARDRTYASWVCTPYRRRAPRVYDPDSLFWRIRNRKDAIAVSSPVKMNVEES